MHTFEEQNIHLLADYFHQGCKPCVPGKLGLELEHFVIDIATEETLTYYEAGGIQQILLKLLPHFNQHYTENGALLGLSCPDYTLSLEPAGQIEISIAPQSSLPDIQRIYESFLALINPILEEQNCRLVTLGYHPESDCRRLPLIPKERYRHMDFYFHNLGTRGDRMMRGTASTQLSIDYENEQDFLLKYRCACLITPAIQLLTDNTPVLDGQPCTTHLIREAIWRRTDSRRCGILPGTFSENFGFEAYARFLYQLPMIFVPEENGCRYTGAMTAAELYSGQLLTNKDIEHIISMIFPDVRLKNYVEIRGADSVPMPFFMAYAAFIKGIFYCKNNLKTLLRRYPVKETDIRLAKDSLMKNGYLGRIYGIPASTFLTELLSLSKQGLNPEEQQYLSPFFIQLKKRKTLAEEYHEYHTSELSKRNLSAICGK